ncbi:MAG TPA: gamma-glutamyl-gamma-aminobutyrate hydrolase family protein [Dermatophilaceae bacterium]|nr:gamma-glutamyl-gamma-aminobutyrate hydrolase family protein [Dermatophilaceae bacterium]
MSDHPPRTPGRPVVGITCYTDVVTRGDWVDQPTTFVPSRYVDFVAAAGGLAVLLPPRADVDAPLAEQVLGRLDALVVAGGADVQPWRYGAEPHALSHADAPDRDAWEIALVRASRVTGTPLLGICRGMQVMAVEAGGTLVQHLPDVVGHEDHSPHLGAYGEHPVCPVPGTRLAGILGEAEIAVPTYHHQGVLTHPGYAVVARHPDGTIEALEALGAREALEELGGDGQREALEALGELGGDGQREAAGRHTGPAPFRLGVQWHPEAGTDLRLMAALLESAGALRG